MKEGVAIRRKRGRPYKAEAELRRDAFLDHALTHFMENGYRATTMERLATTFGASKTTLYRQFANKAGLLDAAMDRAVPVLRLALEAVDGDPSRPPSEVLRDYGAIIQAHHSEAKTLAIWRAVSEAREELGNALQKIIDRRQETLAPIAEYLALLEKNGSMNVGDATAAAACFSEMVTGGVAGFLGPLLSSTEQRTALEFSVGLLLNGVWRRPSRI